MISCGQTEDLNEKLISRAGQPMAGSKKYYSDLTPFWDVWKRNGVRKCFSEIFSQQKHCTKLSQSFVKKMEYAWVWPQKIVSSTILPQR